MQLPKYNSIVVSLDENKVLTVSLNRPNVHNAFNEELISELSNIAKLIEGSKVRVVILTGIGHSFCAGADLNYMKLSKQFSEEENRLDAQKMSEMFENWYNLSKPVLGRINGAAIGGGTGLVSICDISVASSKAKFGFSEVKLGLIPAVIAQFVIEKIGKKNAKEYFLTGSRFSAKVAQEINLVNYVVEPEELDDKVRNLTQMLLSSGPEAIKACKKLIKNVNQLNSKEMTNYAINVIADLRQGSEGQEGIEAFLSKRKPNWVEK